MQFNSHRSCAVDWIRTLVSISPAGTLIEVGGNEAANHEAFSKVGFENMSAGIGPVFGSLAWCTEPSGMGTAGLENVTV